jgi:hypothetical protein
MIDLGLFTGAMQQAKAINEAAKTAQSNKISCMAMNHRIQIATEIIKAAYERQQTSPKTQVFSDNAFKTYVHLLERMRDFIFEISKKKTFSKVLSRKDNHDEMKREERKEKKRVDLCMAVNKFISPTLALLSLLKQLFYALRYRDEFDALLREFDNCVLEVSLNRPEQGLLDSFDNKRWIMGWNARPKKKSQNKSTLVACQYFGRE